MPRLRALLIHKGTKHLLVCLLIQIGLRALLIHKGTKPEMLSAKPSLGLRALLIHKGTKLRLRLLQKILLFESFVNS